MAKNTATGVDCVGLIAAVRQDVGHRPSLPEAYTLRNLRIGRLLSLVADNGLQPREGPMQAGDIVLFSIGSLQHHLAVSDGHGGIVHAHAGLRRVVKGPPDADWKRTAAWHLPPTPGK